MKKSRRSLLPLLVLGSLLFAPLGGCSVRNNTASTRFYHNLTTRYNVYYNGDQAFREAYKKQLQEAPDNYAERIFIEPVTATKSREIKEPGGDFNGALEKGRKAIRLHSIRNKPKERKSGNRNSPFYKKREYNTFIYNAWLLVGQSQYFNGDFLDAMATFSYMARLYKEEPRIRDLARLWQARCYIAMEWDGDAARIIDGVRDAGTSQGSGLLNKTSAELAILQGRIADAIPVLQATIKKERYSQAKTRQRFLLAQLQSEAERYSEARKTFGRVLVGAPPFSIEVAARLNIVSIDARNNPKSAIRKLDGMLKKGRYEKVKDRVALTKGRIHLSQEDTTKALEAFTLGAEKSVEKSFEYALCQVELAEIYLARSQYVKAGTALRGGVTSLDKNFVDYERLSLLSEQLDELSRHAQVVDEQDSLRHLAALPEAERLRIIDSAIADYKKRAKEEAHQQAMEEQKERQQAFNEEMGDLSNRQLGIPPVNQQITDKSFYFYNDQLMAQGKNQFIRTWGTRSLEDDWRRRNKRVAVGVESNLSAPPPDEGSPDDAEDKGKEGEVPSTDPTEAPDSLTQVVEAAQDPEKREFYLATLPFTPEAIATSDGLIQGGYEGMGTVLNEQMERFPEAAVAYEELLRRYPSYEGRLSVYYKLYMLFERLGDATKAAHWRGMMQQQFPKEELTKEISKPAYITSLRQQDSIENALYSRALEAYQVNEAATTLALTGKLLKEYNLSTLRPKALFLQAMGHVAEGDSKAFTASLRMLLDEYPKADVAELAETMLSGVLAGRKIVKDGYSGIDFASLIFGADSVAAEDSLYFVKPSFGEAYAAMLIYPHGAVEVNQLLFAVATFNFSQFTEHNLTLTQREAPVYDVLTVEGLPNINVARSYIKSAYSPRGYMALLDSTALLIPLSKANLAVVQKGMPIGEYMNFVADSLAAFFPEAAIPLERFAAMADEAGEGKPKEAPIEEKKETPTAKSIEERPVEHPNTVSRDITKQSEAPKPLPPDTVLLPDTISLIEPAEPLLETIPMVQAGDSIVPPIKGEESHQREAGKISFEDVKEQRAKRIQSDRERAKEEKARKGQLEKERKEALKQRERERKAREQERLKEQRKREKERRDAQKAREKKLREAQRARTKSRK